MLPFVLRTSYLVLPYSRNRQYSINFFDAISYSNALITLPVSFVSISGEQLADGNRIKWKVAEESNLKEYEIERSTDGISYTATGTVPFQASNHSQ
ncbi:MAG: hypothetical protein ABIR18_07685 [Chitinophagaceae bacterium]